MTATRETSATGRDYARDFAESPATIAPLVLDRERIIDCAAFRRLQFKTQVFVTLRQDHFRTRLTHTLEVAHLARRLAGMLAADSDLAEVAALAHDLGHPPFGHAGEQALNECLSAHGGFEHNAQSLRVVEYLEHPYPEFRGLNLTRVTRECLAKHATRYDNPGVHPLQDKHAPPLEGQIAALADRVAYAIHDIHDGLYAGLINFAALADVPLWRMHALPPDGLPADSATWRANLRPITDRLQEFLLQSAASATRSRLGSTTVAGKIVRKRAVTLPDDIEPALLELETFLHHHLYKHPRIARMDDKARHIIKRVFRDLAANPQKLPPRFADRIETQGAPRVAADYIAGMTDRFILRLNRELRSAQRE